MVSKLGEQSIVSDLDSNRVPYFCPWAELSLLNDNHNTERNPNFLQLKDKKLDREYFLNCCQRTRNNGLRETNSRLYNYYISLSLVKSFVLKFPFS